MRVISRVDASLALATPTRLSRGLARFDGRQFGCRCGSGLLVALTLQFSATVRINGHPAEAEHYSDHEHQHKDLICGHTPSFFHLV